LNKPFKEAIWQLKVELLEKALKKAKYNQKTAAALLGLSYHQFRGLYQYQARLESTTTRRAGG
jgi:psp operon transcriptional activator